MERVRCSSADTDEFRTFSYRSGTSGRLQDTGERGAKRYGLSGPEQRQVPLSKVYGTSIFNRKNNLYSHLKFECGQLPRFGCPYCDYASKKSSNIRAHVRRKHYGYNVSVVNVSRDKTFEATMEDEEDRNLGQTF